MTVKLSAPSKTFLTGEYAVLAGGPALLLNTQPRFELVARAGNGDVKGISKTSPAGGWLKQREPLLNDWDLVFTDPHRGQGGLGASSAQFLLVHAFTTFLQRGFKDLNVDRQALWNDYQVLTSENGSGADVLGQAVGGIARVSFNPFESDSEEWAYPEIGFLIVRTGRKLATHEHLSTVDRERLRPLVELAKTVYDSYDVDPSEKFLAHVHQFAKGLRQLELQSPETLKLLEPIEKQEWCLITKGCGAFGADTALIFYPSDFRRSAMEYVLKRGLQVVATESDMSSGLEVVL